MGTWQLNKDLNVVDIQLFPTFKLPKNEEYNLKSTLKHLIEEVDYNTPNDRLLVVRIETTVSKSFKLCMLIDVIPCFRGELRSGETNKNAEALHRKLSISSNFDTNKGDLLEDGLLQKQLKWILDYFGLTLMYGKQHQQIKIEFEKERVNITYS